MAYFEPFVWNCIILVFIAKARQYPTPTYGYTRTQTTRPGKFAFTSTRNNNFSNRDQKLLLCIMGRDPYTNTYYNCNGTTGPGNLQVRGLTNLRDLDRGPALGLYGDEEILLGI